MSGDKPSKVPLSRERWKRLIHRSQKEAGWLLVLGEVEDLFYVGTGQGGARKRFCLFI